jgi:acyl-CoA thioester hydrolase
MSSKNLAPESRHIVRFGAFDVFGHLNNARYFDYFINARDDHVRDAYQIELPAYAKEGLSWVIAGHEIVYQRPAQYNERVRIRSTLLALDKERVWSEVAMMDAGRTHLKALLWTRWVPVDVKTGRKREHPQDFMDFFLQTVWPEDLSRMSLQERAAQLVAELKTAG